jgi:hypothetical protein
MDRQSAQRQEFDLPQTAMTVDRIQDLADRHGGELSHWPLAEAGAARIFLAVSPEARIILARASRLDRVLRTARSHSVAVNLRERLLAAAPVGGWRELLASLWPFGPVWRPAAALFCVALFGVLLGSSEMAKLIRPTSVNAALSEEVRVVALSAVDIFGDGNQWRE